MADITKAEMMAMLEVQKEAAQQMERVASSLTLITESQNKIVERLDDVKNNCATNLCDIVVQKLSDKFALALVPCKEKNESIKTDTLAIKKDVSVTKDNVAWLRIIIGAATLIIIIVVVVVKLLTPSPNIEKIMHVLHEGLTHNELSIAAGTGRPDTPSG